MNCENKSQIVNERTQSPQQDRTGPSHCTTEYVDDSARCIKVSQRHRFIPVSHFKYFQTIHSTIIEINSAMGKYTVFSIFLFICFWCMDFGLAARRRHPVIYIPGDGGSILEARLSPSKVRRHIDIVDKKKYSV